MLELHLRRGLREAQRLERVRRVLRPAGVDVAVAAGAGAGVAQDLEGRGAPAPALGDVRAAGLLADRVQARAVDQLLDVEVARVGARRAHLHPLGAAGPLGDGPGNAPSRVVYGRWCPKPRSRTLAKGSLPLGEGWFVLNTKDARWRDDGPLGKLTFFEAGGEFWEIGFDARRARARASHGDVPLRDRSGGLPRPDRRVRSSSSKARSARLRAWDFVHCPPGYGAPCRRRRGDRALCRRLHRLEGPTQRETGAATPSTRPHYGMGRASRPRPRIPRKRMRPSRSGASRVIRRVGCRDRGSRGAARPHGERAAGGRRRLVRRQCARCRLGRVGDDGCLHAARRGPGCPLRAARLQHRRPLARPAGRGCITASRTRRVSSSSRASASSSSRARNGT